MNTFYLDVTTVPCLCGISRLSYFILAVRFVAGVGLVLGGFGLVLVVCASFCGGLWGLLVLQVADLGPLTLVVGMGDPWISGLLCVGWFWPLIGGRDS